MLRACVCVCVLLRRLQLQLFPAQQNMEMGPSSPTTEDYYALLHLSPTATEENIRHSFQSMSKHFHPDKIQQRSSSSSSSSTSEETKQYFADHKAIFHEEWVKIHRAKTVLLDPILRPIYDEFGFAGLEFAEQTVLKQQSTSSASSSMTDHEHRFNNRTTEIGFHTPASIRVMQSVREALQARNQNELMGRLSAHTSVQMAVHLDHIFDDKDEPFSLAHMLQGLDVPQLVMQTSVGGRASDRDHCTLSGYVVTRDGLGFGDMQANWRHVWQPGILWTTMNVAAPFSKMFAVDVTRVLNADTGLQVGLGGSVRRGETGISLSASRSVGDDLNASLEWKEGRDSGLTFSLNKKNIKERSSTAFNVQVGGMDTGSGMGAGLTYKKILKDTTSTVRAGVKIGAGEIEVFAGHTRRLTHHSRLGATMTLSLTGVTVKIKYKRGETEFVLPVRLSKSTLGLESPWSIFAGSLMEGFIWAGMEWMMAPRRLREKERIAKAIGIKVRKERKSARAQQKMMISPTNEIIARENNTVHGLIIVEARYGVRLCKKYPWSTSSVDEQDDDADADSDSSSSGNDGSTNMSPRTMTSSARHFSDDDTDSEYDSDSEMEHDDDVVRGMQTRLSDGSFYPPNIDVRIPLQFLVDKNHTLQLSGSVTKSKTLGFCNPSIEENPVSPPKLYVKYSCGGQVYEITFEDEETVMLPSPLAREIPGAEYFSFRSWFQPPSHLKGNRLEEWKREHPTYAYSTYCARVDRQRMALRMLREGKRDGTLLENVVNWSRHGDSNRETKGGELEGLD